MSPSDQYGVHLAEIIIGDRAPLPEPVPPFPLPPPLPEIPVPPGPQPPGLDRPTNLAFVPSAAEVVQYFYDGLAELGTSALATVDEASMVLGSVSFFSVPNPGFFGGSSMAAPAFSGVYGQEWVINDGQNSLREQMYFERPSAAADPLGDARARAYEYRGLRKQLLGGVNDSTENFYPGRARMAHLALVDAKKTGRGGSWDSTGNDGFCSFYTGLRPSDTLWKRISVRLRAATTGVAPLRAERLLLLGGVPDKLILSAKYNSALNTQWNTRWEQFREYLIGNDAAYGPVGNATSSYGMLIHDDRAGTGNERHIVIGAALVTGNIRLTLATNLILAGANANINMDVMQLSRANVPGWNGEYPVRVIDATHVELIEPVRGSARYLFDVLRANPAALPMITHAKLMRVKREDGLPTWVFGKFYEAELIKVVRRRPSPAWSPYQAARQQTA